jgi:hypothetical protein
MLFFSQPLDDVGGWPETQGYAQRNFPTRPWKLTNEAIYVITSRNALYFDVVTIWDLSGQPERP